MEAKRNDPCPCGSGKKFKKCHGQVQSELKRTQRSFSLSQADQHPLMSLTSKLIKVIETDEKDKPLIDRPPSAASSEEAENPELVPPKA